jgi:protocatechuate 3,4-dioxygenase beta subunit
MNTTSKAPLIFLLVLVLLGGGAWLLLSGDEGQGLIRPDPQSSSVGDSTPHKPTTVASGGGITAAPFKRDTDPEHSVVSLGVEETGIHVQGRVTNAAGDGISGALVELVQDLSALKNRFQEGDVLAHVKTGREGEFTIKDLIPGEIYVLRASHAEWTTGRKHPIDAADSSSLQPVVVLDQGHEVSGRVTTSQGAPVVDALVEVHDLSVQTYEPVAPPERFAKTDAEGRYRVKHISPGLKKMIVSAQGHAMDGRNAVDVRSNVADVDFVLTDGTKISGLVLDAVSRQPVVGAIITARPLNFLVTANPSAEPAHVEGDSAQSVEERQREMARRVASGLPVNAAATVNPGRQVLPQEITQKQFLLGTARSDESGRFVLNGLLEARYLLIVRANGYQPNNGFAADAGAQDIEIALQPSAAISGRVIDALTGEPVTRFSIAASAAPDPAFITAQMRQRFNNPNGEFNYVDARPGTIVLIAESDGYAGGRSEPMTILAEQRVTGVTVRLEKGATVSGSLMGRDGKPVIGAQVILGAATTPAADNPFARVLAEQLRSASRKRAVSDAEGKFSIAGVLAGTYKIRAEHSDYSAAESAEISSDGRSTVTLPEIIMERGGTVKGTVKKPDGTPDPRATVMVSAADPGLMFTRSMPTTADGGYEIRGLKPGTYRIVATQRDGQMDLLAILKRAQDPGAMFTVLDGATVTMDL